MEAAFIVATLIRRGMLHPDSPIRVARQLYALYRWGFGLHGEIRQAAARSPLRVAVVDEQRSVTYGELLDRVERLARGLHAGAGIRPGDRVGVLRRNSAGMIETLIGLTVLGADPVLMNTGLSGPQLGIVAQEQQLRAVIHDDEFTALIGTVPGHVERIDEWRVDELIAGAPEGQLNRPERDGRTIVLTSGTTGIPKGARRATPSGFGPLCSLIDRIPLRRGIRMMIAAPLFHTWGYAGLQLALALGATVVLRRRFEAAAALDAMRERQCAALIAVPVMVQNLMELHENTPRPPLRVVAVSGSALPGGLATRFMDRYGDVLYNLYGSTEASWASIATPADLRAAPNTAGRAPHGTRIAVLDATGEPVATGVSGRLFVGNELIFEGYTNGSMREIRDGLLATGDIGHIDENGRVFVDGREDDMIVSGGENVFPAEVEDLLAGLPQVREVAVVGVPDARHGQRLAAYVVMEPGERLDQEAVREYVRRHRARFCVPRDVVFLPALPRNATGKVQTRDLPR